MLEKWDTAGARADISLTETGFHIKANHLEGQVKLRLIGVNCRPRFFMPIQFHKSVGRELLREIWAAKMKNELSLFSQRACSSAGNAE